MKPLSKDADKMVCILYKLYLSKRKNGFDKSSARRYSYSEIKSLKPFDSWSDDDTKSTLSEISRAGFGKMYLDCGFLANDDFIIYMENRFSDGLRDVTDFISKFIP